MSTPDNVGVDQGGSVAFIITHAVKAGEETRYEAWLADILRAVSSFPGYVGREIFRPAHGTRKYTSIVRFDSPEHLNAWEQSEARRSYISQIGGLLEGGDVHEIRTGIDFWFTPEGVKPPKPWKQFLLTLSAVYPLSLVLPRLLGPLLHGLPALEHPLLRGLLIAGTLTALLTFVIMPRYTRLVKRWLYEETGGA
jgi:antibiotic biosynthesis monooxygenase (ABM) superfamily enzyme